MFDERGIGTQLSSYIGEGHTVVIAFSLKCASCLDQASSWAQLHVRYGPQHRFVGLACNSTRTELGRFNERSNVAFVVGICETASVVAMNISQWPAIIEVDHVGEVQFAAEGEAATQLLESHLASHGW